MEQTKRDFYVIEGAKPQKISLEFEKKQAAWNMAMIGLRKMKENHPGEGIALSNGKLLLPDEALEILSLQFFRYL